MVSFFCVKCKEKVEIPEDQTEKVTLKNGKPARKSVCPKCGTKVFKIGA